MENIHIILIILIIAYFLYVKPTKQFINPYDQKFGSIETSLNSVVSNDQPPGPLTNPPFIGILPYPSNSYINPYYN